MKLEAKIAERIRLNKARRERRLVAALLPQNKGSDRSRKTEWIQGMRQDQEGVD